jgi:ketosteroid isomerase-like protein
MSQQNIEIVSEWIDAFNRGGLEESMRLLDPEIEWTTTTAYLEAGTYHGHEGIRRYLRRATAAWEDLQLEPERLVDAREQVVVPMRVTARAKETKTPGGLSLTLLAELQGGMIVRMRNYANETEALEAAGLQQ